MKSQGLSEWQIGLLQRIQSLASMPVFLVGGAVRDLFLGQALQDRDLDLVVEGDAAAFAHRCASVVGGQVKEFTDFLTAKLFMPTSPGGSIEIDLATARTEEYQTPGQLPQVRPAPIAADLRRRDFTVNAVALPLDRLLAWSAQADAVPQGLRPYALDPFSGLADLEARCIRTLHVLSFQDDPTRLFRACRYAVRIRGLLEPETRRQFLAAVDAGALGTISFFRKRNELKKIFSEARWLEVLTLAAQLGLLRSLALVEAQAEALWLERLAKIAAMSVRPDPEVLVLVAFMLVADLSGPPGDSILSEYGFGRKQIQRLHSDMSAAYRDPIRSLSPQALCYGLTVRDMPAQRTSALCEGVMLPQINFVRT